MPAVYPTSIKSFTTKTNKVDLVDAAHVNDLQAEVVAIQTELGTDPAGSETDVKTRLSHQLDGDGSILSGTAFPDGVSIPTYPSQLFYRTDTDLLYMRSAANDNWLVQTAAASDYDDAYTNLLFYAAVQSSCTFASAGSWVKAVEVIIPRSGSIIVQIDAKRTNSDIPSQINVYKNGAIAGTAIALGDLYATCAWTLTGLSKLDLVQIYMIKDSGVGTDTWIKNLCLFSSTPTVESLIGRRLGLTWTTYSMVGVSTGS